MKIQSVKFPNITMNVCFFFLIISAMDTMRRISHASSRVAIDHYNLVRPIRIVYCYYYYYLFKHKFQSAFTHFVPKQYLLFLYNA
jgi:hypothetical protein